uniref:NADH dehydrogenase subunit 2 n=1 Tax=Chandlerella quiscali TaxID=871019 RepID=E1AK23_9BILA|nr:NADH dehydrogenase subunit 2 [Chandlerella quiscali]ADL39024.1 NADH dehydrogenase subunit 2 [Chandlerella quiscali]
MFIFFVFILLVLMSFINFCLMDYIVWWSIFVICTFVFVFFVGLDNISYLINYYVVQEICGYYFLIFDKWKLQFLILLMKSGSAPFHFWLFSVVSGLKKWFILWFLVLQKLPYFPVLINFCNDFFFWFLVFGMFFCYFHFFFLRNCIDMIVISSTESFMWLLIFSIFFSNEVLFFFVFYYLIMFLIIPYVFNMSMNFLSLEMIFIFFNVPMSITFFLKIFLLFGSFDYVGFYYYYLLLLLPLMSLGIGYFFFIYSMINYNYGLKYYDYLIFFFVCINFFSIF